MSAKTHRVLPGFGLALGYTLVYLSLLVLLPLGGMILKASALGWGQIIDIALEAGVFVHESRDLVSLLMDIDLDQQIPPALYRTIAELLAWLYHIESAQKSGLPLPAPPDPLASLNATFTDKQN